MNYHPKALIVVICESFLEEQIVKVAKKQNLKGYTISNARGAGDRGYQSGEFEFDQNVKIEFLSSDQSADKLINTLHTHFFKDYAIIAYKIPVNVLRDTKFT